jgi:hypothetical protein
MNKSELEERVPVKIDDSTTDTANLIEVNLFNLGQTRKKKKE